MRESIKFNFSIKIKPKVDVSEACQAKVTDKSFLNVKLLVTKRSDEAKKKTFYEHEKTILIRSKEEGRRAT